MKLLFGFNPKLSIGLISIGAILLLLFIIPEIFIIQQTNQFPVIKDDIIALIIGIIMIALGIYDLTHKPKDVK